MPRGQQHRRRLIAQEMIPWVDQRPSSVGQRPRSSTLSHVAVQVGGSPMIQRLSPGRMSTSAPRSAERAARLEISLLIGGPRFGLGLLQTRSCRCLPRCQDRLLTPVSADSIVAAIKAVYPAIWTHSQAPIQRYRYIEPRHAALMDKVLDCVLMSLTWVTACRDASRTIQREPNQQEVTCIVHGF